MNRTEKLLKNTVILGVGQFLPKILNLITLPILTSCLTKKEYGTLDLINILITVFIPIITLQLQQALFRYIIDDRDNIKRTAYITSSFLFVFLSALIGISILFLSLNDMELMDRYLVCAYLLLEVVYIMLGQVVRGLGNNKIYSNAVVVNAIINSILIILLVLHSELGLIGALMSTTLAYIVVIFYMVWKVKIHSYINIRNFSASKLKTLICFSLPIVPSAISLWVVNLSDRLIVTRYLGLEMNAVYAVANKIPSIFGVAYSAFNLAWIESAALAFSDKDVQKYFSKSFAHLFDFLIGIILLLVAATPIIFKVLINDSYDMAYYQIPILYTGVFLSSLVSFYGGIYIAIQQTKTVGLSSILAAGINICFNIMFIKQIGLYAASISTVVAYFVIVLYRAIDINRRVYIQYDYKHICHMLLIFTLTCLLCYQRNYVCNIINIIIGVHFFYRLNGNLIKRGMKMFIKNGG